MEEAVLHSRVLWACTSIHVEPGDVDQDEVCSDEACARGDSHLNGRKQCQRACAIRASNLGTHVCVRVRVTRVSAGQRHLGEREEGRHALLGEF